MSTHHPLDVGTDSERLLFALALALAHGLTASASALCLEANRACRPLLGLGRDLPRELLGAI